LETASLCRRHWIFTPKSAWIESTRACGSAPSSKEETYSNCASEIISETFRVLSIEGRTLLESSDDIRKLIFTSMSGSNWKGCCRFINATGAAKNPEFHENLKKYRRKKIFPKIDLLDKN
jgi:hypothetical protein